MRPSMDRFYPMKRSLKTAKSCPECAAHSLDDAILRHFVEIGVHRQADDVVREPLARGQPAVRDRIMLVGGLLVDRLGIVDRSRYPLRLQRCGEAVAVG